MADVDDRWFVTQQEPGETPVRVKTSRHGVGKRYRARWRDANGRQRARSFDLKREADDWLAQVATELARGTYIDRSAGKMRLEDYGARWLTAQTFDPSTREAVELRLRLHVYPTLGRRELRAIRPSDVQAWTRSLESGLAPTTISVIFANLSGLFKAAIDDGLIGVNPCAPRSVRPPPIERRKVIPWPADRVEAMRLALPDRYQATVTASAGAGLRQGEVFGLSPDDIDRDRKVIHVRRQVKIVGARLVFAPPKRGKSRDVPLSDVVANLLADHAASYAPTAVMLPWKAPDGPQSTVRLVFSSREKGAMNRNYFNRLLWNPARKVVGLSAERENGMHALRHFFASVVLDGGASIRDLAEWLGHEDPGFTLRVYAHLLPNSADKLRAAVDHALRGELR